MSSPERIEVRSPVRAGEVVDGKYRITGILGAGGMGVVVSAMQLALDEPVALKFMTAEGKADETARARFLREAKAARKLTSAHVARVFDVGQLRSGEPYIVMELLEGDDLGKHLRLHGRLTTADTVRFMLQVCDAIREAHALGIVHRDLKPQNLFLCKRPGSGPVIKVLDFGIAKSLNVSDSDGSLTASQNVVGSPVYMSPEQLRASKHVDTRTDIWSMGVIMFELLSGKVPFAGDSVLELGMRIMTVPAPSLVELRAEVPAALADVVQRCLEKDPESRYATIDALAADLKQFLDTSQPQLPFADTMDGPLGDRDSDHIRTGGDRRGYACSSRRPFPSRSAACCSFAATRPPRWSPRPWPLRPFRRPTTPRSPCSRTPHGSASTARRRKDSPSPVTSPWTAERTCSAWKLPASNRWRYRSAMPPRRVSSR